MLKNISNLVTVTRRNCIKLPINAFKVSKAIMFLFILIFIAMTIVEITIINNGVDFCRVR